MPSLSVLQTPLSKTVLFVSSCNSKSNTQTSRRESSLLARCSIPTSTALGSCVWISYRIGGVLLTMLLRFSPVSKVCSTIQTPPHLPTLRPPTCTKITGANTRRGCERRSRRAGRTDGLIGHKYLAWQHLKTGEGGGSFFWYNSDSAYFYEEARIAYPAVMFGYDG
jgi:hypothetical protein